MMSLLLLLDREEIIFFIFAYFLLSFRQSMYLHYVHIVDTSSTLGRCVRNALYAPDAQRLLNLTPSSSHYEP